MNCRDFFEASGFKHNLFILSKKLVNIDQYKDKKENKMQKWKTFILRVFLYYWISMPVGALKTRAYFIKIN